LNFQFEHIVFAWLFVGIAVLILLFAAWIFWKRSVKRKLGDSRLIKHLVAGYSANKFVIKFTLIVLSFALGVFAVMNPRKAGGSDKTQRKGIDIAIALDVSKSMLAADLPPNRLERAKQFINKFMAEMPDDRVALILFAGKAYMQMPLTVDHGAAQLFVSSATPDAVPQQGTVIGDALEMSAKVFNSTEKRFKAVVLISDGEDHDPSAIRTAADLAEKGVMINTVGIGSAEGSTITDPLTGELKRDETGNTVVTKLNEDELKNIASKTNGIYIHLEGSDAAVAALKSQLSQIDRKAYGDVSLMNFTSYYPWLAAAMLLFLLIETLISENRAAAAKMAKEIPA
jgi:Ca-activated chloride channel family protein